MHKRNVNNWGFAASTKGAAGPLVVTPLATWHELMPQTVTNRRDVSRYGIHRWKLLPILKENS